MNILVVLGCSVVGFFMGKTGLAYLHFFYGKLIIGLLTLIVLAIAMTFIPFVGEYTASLVIGMVIGIVASNLFDM